MKEKLLHTPDGVRDIYHSECKRKKALEAKLHEVLSLYGYQDIETPAFEFFDIFNSDTGTVSSREMFKFFDRNNNTLVLRPDMTPSVARSVAKYYLYCSYPLRLSYVGKTFMNNHSLQGKLAERTELGVEHINENSPQADAEAVVMMIDCFLKAGLEEFRIDIGQTEFYRAVMDGLHVPEQTKDRIHDLIENKNSLGMDLLLSETPIDEKYRKLLSEYNELYGDVTMLDRAMALTSDPDCLQAISRLKQVYKIICDYGYEKYVGFDLGMVNYYDYYTGIIFRGYTYGTGDAIGKGGRYDNLLTQFGKNAPAIGFTILIDDLLMALSQQNIHISLSDYAYSVLLYEPVDGQTETAISLAKRLRASGKRIEMSAQSQETPIGEYLSFQRFQGAQEVFILDGNHIDIYNFKDKHSNSSQESSGHKSPDKAGTASLGKKKTWTKKRMSIKEFGEEYGI